MDTKRIWLPAGVIALAEVSPELNEVKGGYYVPAAALDAAEGPDVDALAADVLEMCKLRGWSLRWTERGVYLHLEASELIEAIRGKHGDPQKEAADVLLVLMSITENAGIPFSSVIETTRANVAELKTKPHYAGEEFAPPEKG